MGLLSAFLGTMAMQTSQVTQSCCREERGATSTLSIPGSIASIHHQLTVINKEEEFHNNGFSPRCSFHPPNIDQ
jgi:hypothetical protein